MCKQSCSWVEHDTVRCILVSSMLAPATSTFDWLLAVTTMRRVLLFVTSTNQNNLRIVTNYNICNFFRFLLFCAVHKWCKCKSVKVIWPLVIRWKTTDLTDLTFNILLQNAQQSRAVCIINPEYLQLMFTRLL